MAVSAHAGQTEKAGKPYILHPLRVMFQFRSEITMIVAVLHDVVEDSPDWTFDRLRGEGFSEDILDALDGLTKRPQERDDYMAFITRASANPIAKAVKLADIEDNLDVSRLAEIGEKDHARLTKYIAARKFLLNSGA